MLYFAYGSNMWRSQMRRRCPDHELIGKAVLPGYALCFPRSSPIRNCGVAGIEEAPGSEVWGVVYRLHDEDLAALDRREGYYPHKPAHVNLYMRATVHVLRNGAEMQCVTYLARGESGQHLPNADYMMAIITGAEENELPVEYISRLRTVSTSG